MCKKIYNSGNNTVAASLHEYLLSISDYIIEAIIKKHFTNNEAFRLGFIQYM